MATQPIKSPCILVCQPDASGRTCLGCGRSTAEIARWATMSEAEREAIMAELPARMASLGVSRPPPRSGEGREGA